MRLRSRDKVSTSVSEWLNFNPSIFSPFLWLDASDLSTITESGGAVSQWSDKSGNNRNVSQATPASRPTLLTNAQNGKSTISFDASNDWLSISAAGFPTTGNRTMFAAFKYTGSASIYQHIAIWGNSGLDTNRSWGLTTFFISPSYFGRVHIWANTGASPFTASSMPTNKWNQLSASYNGAATTIWGNGKEGETKALVIDTLTNQDFRVGTRTWNPAEYWHGEIGEIILFDYLLTEKQRISVEKYLENKWSTTQP